MPRTVRIYDKGRQQYRNQTVPDQYSASGGGGIIAYGGGSQSMPYDISEAFGILQQLNENYGIALENGNHKEASILDRARRKMDAKIARLARKYGGLSGLGATRIRKLPAKPPKVVPSVQPDFPIGKYVIGGAALLVLGSFGLYLWKGR